MLLKIYVMPERKIKKKQENEKKKNETNFMIFTYLFTLFYDTNFV